MTRRRTSVIGPGKAAAHQPPPPTPGPDTSEARLWHWGLMATRELSLSLLGEEGQEAQQLQAVRRRWRIAQGRESGNPAPSSGRSVVNRIAEASGQAFWRKHFDGDQLHWQLNELAVLTYLGTQDRQSQHGLREQVAWMRQVKTHEGSSSLQTVETLDAGPSLDDWREFAPCALVQGLPLPLFAQADFLAALTRQALIGLERLARHHVVHNDIKPSNLCLALGLPPKAHEHCFSTVLDLQRLPLRFIDFELAFAPSAPRLVQAHQNVWVSPYARACHAAAAEDQLHPEDRLARLAGIDWGADLWSLGFMVAEWVKAAQSYLGAWLDAVRQTWGDGSNTYHLADRVVGQQSRALGALSRFAKTLQAQDRPVSDAGQTRLPKRDELPHGRLRADLESHYPVLTQEAKHSQRQLTLIDPEAPLDLPAPVAWGERGRAFAQHARRYRRTAVVALALVGSGTALWAGKDSLWQAATGTLSNAAYHLAEGWRSNGGAWRWDLMRKVVHWHVPSGRDGVMRSIHQEPAWSEPPAQVQVDRPEAVVAQAQAARLSSLRALALWYESFDKWREGDGPALALRLLNKLYLAQNRLEELKAATETTDELRDTLSKAQLMLGSLEERFPLASMMAVHLGACYQLQPTLGPRDWQSELNRLAQVPDTEPSARDYQAYAQAARQRLAQGQSVCPISDHTPRTSTTP